MVNWFVEQLFALMQFVEWVGVQIFGLVHGKTVEEFVFVFTLMVALMFFTMTFETVLRFVKSIICALNISSIFKVKELGKRVYTFLMRIVYSAKVIIAVITLLLSTSWVIGTFFYQVELPTKEHFKKFVVNFNNSGTSANNELAQLSASESKSLEVEKNTREALGQMGDFFGGMLNPILAFASLIALLYSSLGFSRMRRIKQLRIQLAIESYLI